MTHTPETKVTRESDRVAIYPGSFDPLTNGHVDIITRGAAIFDRIIVAILHNSEKSPLFTVDERVEMARQVFAHEPKVEVETFGGLLVDFARLKGAHVIVRGLRAISRLRVRVPDGADEPPAGPGTRDGVHDAGRIVHLHQLPPDS